MTTCPIEFKVPDQQSTNRNISSIGLLQVRVEYALRNLGDRSVLNRSPLASLTYIKELAASRYKGHLFPNGLALHDVLISCVQNVSAEVGNDPGLSLACKYLQYTVEGLSSTEISKRFGLSREHVSRMYRKKAIELITEGFLSRVHGSL